MTALEKLIELADGTTDESMHVLVPVSLIRELQAWMPGEKERLTTNGAKAWAGVDAQSLRDQPEHVQRAEMDALIREAAIRQAAYVVRILSWKLDLGKSPLDPLTKMERFPVLDDTRRNEYDRAIRILRHFGLIVEHGDGVVSIRDNVEVTGKPPRCR